MLVIQPLAVVLAAPVFFLAILATRYVSLGSLLGSAAMFPATLLIWAVASGWVPPAYLVWAAVGPVLIWLAHADNIDRLLHGQERKFDLGLITGGRRQGGAIQTRRPSARAARRFCEHARLADSLGLLARPEARVYWRTASGREYCTRASSGRSRPISLRRHAAMSPAVVASGLEPIPVELGASAPRVTSPWRHEGC